MSTCFQCGASCPEGSAFCPQCGASLHAYDAAPAQVPQAQVTEGRIPAAQPAQTSYQHSTYQQPPFQQDYQQPYGYQQPYAGQQPHPGQQPYGGGVYASGDGILSQAWNDLVKSKGWFGKSLLLALLSIVPVLNFVVIGYRLRFAKDAALAARPDLPERIFAERGFVLGFFAFLVYLVAGVAYLVLDMVPFVGFVAALALMGPVELALVYMATVNDFAAAFSLGRIWEILKRGAGSVLACFWIPTLITMALVAAISTIAGVLISISLIDAVGMGALALESYPYMAPSFGVMTVVTIVLCIVLALVLAVVDVVCSLVICRALGIWVSRFAPEWVAEANARAQYAQNPPQPWQQ